MKKVLSFILAGLISPAICFADSTTNTQNDLIGLGMSPELATEVTKHFGTAIRTNPVVATVAATPVNTFAPQAVIPTAAANAGGFLPRPIPTPGEGLGAQGSRVSIYNGSGNAQLIWPLPNTTGTPVAGTILGFGTPVAAGTPASLPNAKKVDCFLGANNVWYCSMGS